jgi:hypothetical protein
MSERWPALAAQFGLNGVGPVDDQVSVLKPSEYVSEHVKILEEEGIKTGQVFQAQFLDSYGYCLDFDRWLSLEKARSVSFVLDQGV